MGLNFYIYISIYFWIILLKSKNHKNTELKWQNKKLKPIKQMVCFNMGMCFIHFFQHDISILDESFSLLRTVFQEQ